MNHRLSIASMHNHYVVPGDHPAPENLRTRMDRLALGSVAPASGTALEQSIDPHDESIWFIRRLEFDLTIDAGNSASGELVRIWSGQIAGGILRMIARGPDNHTVVHFENRDAYIARFVEDVAECRAWSRWYYRPFEGLRSLSQGTAIREAILREPERARAVVLRLAASPQWESILRALSEQDARQILRACRPLQSSPIEAGALLALAETWQREPWRPAAHAALTLGARVGFKVDAAALLEQFAARVRQQDDQGEPDTAAQSAQDRVFTSPYGASFLLLPYITETAPDVILASPALRLLLAAELLGCRESFKAMLDPALLLATGFRNMPRPEDLAVGESASQLLATACHDALRAFTRRLHGFHESSPEFLRQNFLAGISTIQETTGLIEVNLPPVPLRILLRFAGIHGKTYRVPWLEDSTIRLRLSEE